MIKKITENVIYHLRRNFLDEIYAKRFYRFSVSPIFEHSETPELIRVKLELLNLQPEVIKRPPKGNVVVFAPHFDDEIIGCGGAVLKHLHENKDNVSIVYVTDSAYRGRGQERKEESKKVLNAVNISDVTYLELPEKKFENNKKNISLFKDILKTKEPKTIYLPFFLDAHVDHQMCNRVLVSAMKEMNKKYRIFGYEVWSLIPLNVVFDISAEFNEKMKLIGMYKSQFDTCDYINFTGGLNRLRARYLEGARGKAEGFFTLPSDEYISIFERSKI